MGNYNTGRYNTGRYNPNRYEIENIGFIQHGGHFFIRYKEINSPNFSEYYIGDRDSWKESLVDYCYGHMDATDPAMDWSYEKYDEVIEKIMKGKISRNLYAKRGFNPRTWHNFCNILNRVLDSIIDEYKRDCNKAWKEQKKEY